MFGRFGLFRIVLDRVGCFRCFGSFSLFYLFYFRCFVGCVGPCSLFRMFWVSLVSKLFQFVSVRLSWSQVVPCYRLIWLVSCRCCCVHKRRLFQVVLWLVCVVESC